MFDFNNSKKLSLEYAKDVPRDYDVSKMQFTYDFIYMVLKRDSNIDEAIEDVSNKYGLSDDYLRNYLIENKYILNKVNSDEFSKRLKGYNTKSLKKILKKHGLKTSGKRDRIEKRIFESNLLVDDYHLSSKSKVFYKNKKRRVNIFDNYLSDYYYFDEFNEFYMDNYRKKEANIPIEFIKMHIGKSVADKNHENYLLNSQIMAQHFFIKEKCRKMLEYVLKTYCMNLNPIWKINDLKDHAGVLTETCDCLMFLKEKLGKNAIISSYYPIWDSFNFDRIIVSKYDGYRVLKDILNQKDLDKINRNLDSRFYSNRDLKIKTIVQKTLFDF